MAASTVSGRGSWPAPASCFSSKARRICSTNRGLPSVRSAIEPTSSDEGARPVSARASLATSESGRPRGSRIVVRSSKKTRLFSRNSERAVPKIRTELSDLVEERLEQIERILVRPLEIVGDQHQRAIACDVGEQLQQRQADPIRHQALVLASSFQLDRRIDVDPEKLADERGGAIRFHALIEGTAYQLADHLALGPLREVRIDAASQHRSQQREGDVALHRLASADERDHASLVHQTIHLQGEPRLSDPGWTDRQHHLPARLKGAVAGRRHQSELGIAPEQRRRPDVRRRRILSRHQLEDPGVDRVDAVDAFERLGAQRVDRDPVEPVSASLLRGRERVAGDA